MNYITILTPDNIEIEYRLAGPGSRIAAVCLDLIAQALALIAFALVCYYTLLRGSIRNIDTLNDTAWGVSVILTGIFIIIFGYYIAVEVIFDGQTLGKKLLGLRVIRDNGAPIGLVQSLVRNCIKLFVDMFGIGVFMIWFSKKSKRLGDMAAGTVVIACDAGQISLDLDIDAYDKTNAAHTQINNKLVITRREKRLLREFFASKDWYTDGGASAEAAFAAYFGKKFGIPEEMFTTPVLRWMLENN